MIKNKLMLMLCAIGMTFSMSTKVLASNNIQRIWGSDRYATAIEVSKSGWANGSEYAVLANGENFPDALSAAPLAKKYNAPILLNPGSTLDSRVEDELKRLGVKQVFIIGGSAVVPDSVKNRLEALNIKTTRLWGQDRYETSIKIAEQLDFNGEVSVANGENFPDALSISPIAAQKSMPVILTPSNTLPDVVAKYIKSNKITKSYIIGEDDVVSDKILNSFPNSERIWGSSKYDTNIAVLRRFQNELNFDKIYMANGENFPDALSGSALAAKNSTCVLLVSDYIGLPTEKFSFDKLPSVKDTEILGGTAVVPDSLVNKVVYPDENEVTNLRLSGSEVRQGDWIYYSTGDYDNASLFKYKTDGTSTVKLCDKGAYNITVIGDWIYYNAIAPELKTSTTNQIAARLYKIKTDGTSDTELSDEPCVWFKIVDNKIYSSSDNSFTTMDLDGGNKINVPVNSMIASPNIIDNYFYYIEQPSEGASKIYKMKNDGTDKVQISSEESYNLYDLKIYNDRLYFTSSNDGHVFHLENMKLDGTEKTSLVDINGGGSFDIYDDWIYYAGLYESNLYKIKIDGSSNTKLLDTPAAAVTSVSNGWIYYYYHTGDDELCFGYKKVRIDGTDNRDY
ncbi:cell wall-binding repeat-containing protein [Clostridium sp. WILCCON 0269]|uniref:Cell wall-binding repeat-containing protein n=1 Tax=Candidatus Clostridium eludens TaxID=3381663 RepID=A0ABW8SFT8_9CLOT